MNYQNFEDFNKTSFKIDENNISLKDIHTTPFLFLQEHKKNYKNMAKTAIKGLLPDSNLSKLFFSQDNIKRIQKKIRKNIYERTKGEFQLEVDQDIDDLLIAMRAVYSQKAKFQPGQTIRQVKRLNDDVVNEIVPNMITEIKQEYGYLKEINKPLTPIPRPMNCNKAGRRALPSMFSTFN